MGKVRGDMTSFHVLARRMALAATVVCVFAGALSTWPSVSEARKAKAAAQPAGPSAQGPQAGNPDAKAAEKEAAQKAYDAGLKAFAAGKYQSSIEQLSTAVKSGTLAPPAMAKALLTRGLAYKKTNQPGQAISDLTSAIWLKNGLSPSDQKSAIAERSEAYRMAGLSDTGSTPDQRAIGAKAPAATAEAGASTKTASGPDAGSAGLSAAAIAEAAGAQKAAAGADKTATITQTAVNGETTLQSAASPAVASQETKPAASSSGIGSIFGWGQSSTPEPAPAAPSSGSSFSQTVTAIPGNVSGFFSNMFSGGSSTPAPDAGAPAATVTTASTAAAPETSSWSSATTVASRSERESFKAQKASYAPEVQQKSAVLTKGKFKIYIAALRSKAEAEALAQKLVAEHGAELGNHAPVVDSAVIGSMGTFYRVRIGGYASDAEPRSLCNKLRSSGLDCLVVTN
ncbi:MAG: SPOR domain-containing protein [Hyphomicrobium sp.]|uniref:SPOR domain-containing protein n=1 Tax=Hyphomicrobium sp. TaxID=82 RepID=UPI0039E2951A